MLPGSLDTSHTHYFGCADRESRNEIAMLNGIVKWVIVAVLALYIISPIDFIPDFIPIVGWIDDIIAGIILIGMILKK